MKLRMSATALLLVVLAARPSALDTSQQKALAAAHDKWAEGDYIGALNAYVALLNAPGGDGYLEPIALQTGELYRSTELTMW